MKAPSLNKINNFFVKGMTAIKPSVIHTTVRVSLDERFYFKQTTAYELATMIVGEPEFQTFFVTSQFASSKIALFFVANDFFGKPWKMFYPGCECVIQCMSIVQVN